jgi:hypothetical protein
MPILATVNVANPLKIRIHYTSTVANNNFRMQLGYQIFSVGALSPATYTNVDDTFTAPATAGNLTNYLTVTAVIPGGVLAAQDWLNLVFTRLPGDALDTNTGTLQILNFTMEQ